MAWFPWIQALAPVVGGAIDRSNNNAIAERRKSRWYQSAYGYWRRCGQHDLPVGQKQEVDPGWADTDTLEQEYGDIVGNIHGAFKYFADVIYHAKRNTRFRWPSSKPKVICPRARPYPSPQSTPPRSTC